MNDKQTDYNGILEAILTPILIHVLGMPIVLVDGDNAYSIKERILLLPYYPLQSSTNRGLAATAHFII